MNHTAISQTIKKNPTVRLFATRFQLDKIRTNAIQKT